MLDILGNLDIVNGIVQHAIDEIRKKKIEIRWNFLSSDIGYTVNISETKKNNIVFQIKNNNLQALCKIFMAPNGFTVRFSPKLIFAHKSSSNTFSTNLFDEPFLLEDMESTFFTQSCVEFSTDIIFDYDIMICTLQKAKELYSEYLAFIEKRENETV